MPLAAVALLAVSYAALVGGMALRRHQNLHSHALDLGYTDQAVWNTLHGRPFRFSTYLDAAFALDIPIERIRQPDMLLAYHVEPVLIPISFLYLLYDGPETLLWLQTVAIALGAIPVYLLVRYRFERGSQAPTGRPAAAAELTPQPRAGDVDPESPASDALLGVVPWLPISFVLLYLLAPPLQAANLSDFHAVALSPVLLLAAFYFLETDRPWAFAGFAFVATMCKEEVGLLVAMMGLWAAMVRRRWLLGLVTAAAAAGWSLLSVLVIMPHYSGLSTSAFTVRYSQFGATADEVLRTVVSQPGMLVDWLREPAILRYLRDLWLSSGGLAILYPLGLVMALPSVAINALSQSDWMHSGGGHYSATIVPFLTIAAIYGVAWLASGVARATGDRWALGRAGTYRLASLVLALAGLGVAMVHHYQNGASPPSQRFSLEAVSDHAHRAAPLIEQVNDLPPEVPISAGSNLYPHVAHRERVYLYPTVSDAEFVLLDVTGPGSPVGVGEQRTILQDLLEYGQFGVAASDHGVLLLERGLSDYRLSPAFYDVFDAGGAVPQTPVGAGFGGLVRLDGFDWDVRPVVRPEQVVRITTYWQALVPLEEELRLVFYFWDEAGRLVRIEPEVLAMNWYPTWLWEPGQRARLALPPLPLGNVGAAGVAVLHFGAAVDDLEGRVQPITPAGGQPLLLREQGTIVELAKP